MERHDWILTLQDSIAKARRRGHIVGFVPTMGYLHRGHMSLVARARDECGFVVASIFVNPLQFGPQEDLRSYPRDLERDASMLAEAGVDAIFSPGVEDMYPQGFATHVNVKGLSDTLCGQSRPGHFRGVATVVTKLFNLVRPDRAYFGQKDAQQLLIIRRLAADLNSGVQVMACPTVREEDGLAMSSRNSYLNPAERQAAPLLYRTLCAAEAAIAAGETRPTELEAMMGQMLGSHPLVRPDYVRVADADTLQQSASVHGRLLLAAAAYVGRARLIDNLALHVTPSGPTRILL